MAVELLTQRRNLASVTLLAVVPGGRVAMLNFRNARMVRVPALLTRKSPLLPKLELALPVST